MPWRLSLPPPVARGGRRLLGRFGLGRNKSVAGPDPLPVDQLLQAGHTLREAREAQGLGLRELAHQTRISTAVLEALERGWRDRLPEGAYLRTMLPLLEHHLRLPEGSLHGAQPPETPRLHGGPGGRLLRFTPGSIDVFTTWQGTVLYGILILGLIYGLNLQQQRLAARGLLTVGPLPSRPDRASGDPQDTEQPLLKAYPELKPLRRAATGQGLRLVRSDKAVRPKTLASGQLTLRLETPTLVRLSPKEGKATTFADGQGELALRIQPPFRLSLDPPPPPGAVRWNGTALTPIPSSKADEAETGPGAIYRYPAAPPPAAQAPAAPPSAASPRP